MATISTSAATAPMMANIGVLLLSASPEALAGGKMVGDADGGAVGAVGADEEGDPDGDNDGLSVGDDDGVAVVGVLDGKAVGADVMRSPLEKQTSTSVVVGTDSLDPQAWVQGESSERKVWP